MKKNHSQILPIDRSNVDTDLIIPADFLKSITKQGLGQHLFARVRVIEDDFPLNLPQYQKAQILVSRNNFGCGSSREHAAWALADWGIKIIIASSFADIFYNNAFNNHILPIQMPSAVIDSILAQEKIQYPYEITVDLPEQSICLPSGEKHFFAIDPYRKECLIHGMDDLDYLLSRLEDIRSFQNICFVDTQVMYKHLLGEHS